MRALVVLGGQLCENIMNNDLFGEVYANQTLVKMPLLIKESGDTA